MATNENPPVHPLSNAAVNNMAQPSVTPDHPNPVPGPAATLPDHYLIGIRELLFRVELNHADEELVPRRFLGEAEKSQDVVIPPWIFHAFRTEKGLIDLGKWSKWDQRFREVFERLARIPIFRYGLFRDANPKSDGPMNAQKHRRFAHIVKLQERAVVFLLKEILNGASIVHKTSDDGSETSLAAKYIKKRNKYYAGKANRFFKGPKSNAYLAVDHHPDDSIFGRRLLPISVTTKPHPTLPGHFTKAVQFLLGQLTYQLRDVTHDPRAVPDQEAFHLHLHGSHLHLLRLVAPGFKTSLLQDGKTHIVFIDEDDESYTSLSPHIADQIAQHYLEKSDGDPNALRDCLKERHIRKVLEHVAWHRLYRGIVTQGTVEELINSDIGVFQVLVSREYNLWSPRGFRAAVRMLLGLCLYLMSGEARVGSVQKMFQKWPKAAKKDDEDDDYDEADFDWFWNIHWDDDNEDSSGYFDEFDGYEDLEEYEAEVEDAEQVQSTVHGNADEGLEQLEVGNDGAES
ncbi:uncharacterized protein BO97DRAFT_423460 [Aspergillus homomorphus CBS 101889]|uniref:Uncharacterized protein n=1 Tax=Aspergillus homomorphus (strain CBS 101889) TaxID=1450537 RepID=A0A395I0G3_ASPHC|nr:hypothetical protein BO97DRAFT_423460 [Aspergillus homomorphus CBS 101889]RAL13681.1 hypothetical protein BO97DRAFT_423460 [Aspergillus homomorphus CBS 101889]